MSGLVDWLGGLIGVEWARPLALLGGIPAVLVLLAGLVRERPIERPIGTMRLWRELLDERSRTQPQASRQRRRFPVHLWVLALALIFAVISMAGPRPKQPPLQRRFTVYVDATPSMQLPWNGGDRTRAEVANEEFERWRASVSGVSFEFREGVPQTGGRPGDIVLTDDAAPWRESRAGLFASGGSAVPGVIGLGKGERGGPAVFVLTAEGEVKREARTARPFVACRGSLPGALRSVLDAWAAERGLAVAESAADVAAALLVVNGPEGRTERGSVNVEGGIGGWSARGPIEALPDRSPRAVVWVRSADGTQDLVRHEPGSIRVAWTSWTSREGSDADFALSWARLFDRVTRTPREVVGAGERRAAGESFTRAPKLEDAPTGLLQKRPVRFPLEFQAAVAAFLLACTAALLRARA